MMAIDFEQMKEDYEEQQGDFETLPEGDYLCYVYELEGATSSNDNPMINITLKVADGEYKNRNLWTNVTLISRAWWKVEEFFEAVKYDIANLPAQVETPSEAVAKIRDDVVGRVVEAEVEHRTYKGEERENVTELRPTDEEPEKDVEDDEEIPF